MIFQLQIRTIIKECVLYFVSSSLGKPLKVLGNSIVTRALARFVKMQSWDNSFERLKILRRTSSEPQNIQKWFWNSFFLFLHNRKTVFDRDVWP